MLVIQLSRHYSEQILARQWEVMGKRAKLRKESEGKEREWKLFYFYLFYFFMMKSSDDGRDEFSDVAWKLSGIQHPGCGWEVHSTSQERWMKTFWRVILCLSLMTPRVIAHSQISDFWRGCRLSSVSGSKRVLSMWLFYMQASVSWT